MADSNPGVTPPSGSPGQPNPAPSGGTDPNAPPPAGPKYVTEDQFKTVLDRLEGQSRILAGLKKTDPPPKPSEPSGEGLTLAKQNEELTKLRQAIHGEKRQSAIEATVAARLGKKTEHFRKYVLAVHGDRIKVGEDMSVYVEDNGERTPVAKWVDAFLETDEGKLFLPAPTGAPVGDGLQNGPNGAPKTNRFLSMTKAQIWAERDKDRAGFDQYVMEHEADWHKKLASA